MKILSFNVNGIRAFIKKKGIDFLIKENPDIICIQESKICPDKLNNLDKILEDYLMLSNCSITKKGYSGTITFIKTKFKEHISNIKYNFKGNELNQGRIISFDYKKITIINVYTPNSGVNLNFKERRLLWDKLFNKYIKTIKNKVLICGDLNVAKDPEDVYDGLTNKKRKETPGFTDYERANFKKLLKDNNLNILNTNNNYTYYSYRIRNGRKNNKGWRIDYFIGSSRLVKKVKSFKVYPINIKYSDHLPLLLNIQL